MAVVTGEEVIVGASFTLVNEALKTESDLMILGTTMGIARFRAGKFKDAVEHLLKYTKTLKQWEEEKSHVDFEDYEALFFLSMAHQDWAGVNRLITCQ